MRIEYTTPAHWEALCDIARREIPMFRDMTLREFAGSNFFRQGWTLFNDENMIVGSLSLSDYVLGVSVLMHCSIDRSVSGRWVTRKLISDIKKFVNETLGAFKVCAYSIVGQTDHVEDLLIRLGFVCEGQFAKEFLRHNVCYDIKRFGLLL